MTTPVVKRGTAPSSSGIPPTPAATPARPARPPAATAPPRAPRAPAPALTRQLSPPPVALPPEPQPQGESSNAALASAAELAEREAALQRVYALNEKAELEYWAAARPRIVNRNGSNPFYWEKEDKLGFVAKLNKGGTPFYDLLRNTGFKISKPWPGDDDFLVSSFSRLKPAEIAAIKKGPLSLVVSQDHQKWILVPFKIDGHPSLLFDP